MKMFALLDTLDEGSVYRKYFPYCLHKKTNRRTTYPCVDWVLKSPSQCPSGSKQSMRLTTLPLEWDNSASKYGISRM
jgi:hypothetical protein